MKLDTERSRGFGEGTKKKRTTETLTGVGSSHGRALSRGQDANCPDVLGGTPKRTP